jgi:hypothetical protein
MREYRREKIIACRLRSNAAMSTTSLPTRATWFFDVVSPFSYLALGEIEQLAQSMSVAFRPVLFAALLQRLKFRRNEYIPTGFASLRRAGAE